MSCTKPLLGYKQSDGTYKITSASGVQNLAEHLAMHPNCRVLPCGHCMECRLEYSRQWANRMMLELSVLKKAIFLTLTYDDSHVPVSEWSPSVPPPCFLPCKKQDVLLDQEYLVPSSLTLVKRDVQLFIKRLRKHFKDIKIRYYLAGEYGDVKYSQRPHYHAIIYGLSIDDFKTCERGELCRTCSCSEEKYRKCVKSMLKVPCGKNELGDRYFTSPLLESIWKNGHILFSEVSWKTCAYVARYVTKKVNGSMSLDYVVRNVQPEFSLQSRRPGIGRLYLDRYPDVFDFSSINVSSPQGGLKMPIPKYFKRVMNTEKISVDEKRVKNPLYNKEKYDILKEQARENAFNVLVLRHKDTDLCEIEYLDMCERAKKDSLLALKRNKI